MSHKVTQSGSVTERVTTSHLTASGLALKARPGLGQLGPASGVLLAVVGHLGWRGRD